MNGSGVSVEAAIERYERDRSRLKAPESFLLMQCVSVALFGADGCPPHVRPVLETVLVVLPIFPQYEFTPYTRAEILEALWDVVEDYERSAA
jgi:hypothetical protein